MIQPIKHNIGTSISGRVTKTPTIKTRTANIKPITKDNSMYGDLISAGGNLIGTLASGLINSSTLNNLKEPPKPLSLTPKKLKTKININPQLDKMRETAARYERMIDNSTASSRVALARKNLVRNNLISDANELYGNKENLETQLLNQDSLNQQDASYKNTMQYNQYQKDVAEFENKVADLKGENAVASIENANNIIGNTIDKYKQHKKYKNNLKLLSSLAPSVSKELLKEKGLEDLVNLL